jgi:DNA-directed RNA polymerase subunit L
LDLATAYRVEHTSAHDTDLSLISGVDLKLIRDVDYTLAALIRDIDSILVQKIDVRHEVDFSVAHTLIRTLAFDIALSQETGITLKCDLQKIRDELLDLSNKNQKEIKQWWQVNYHDWTERLRNLMIQYRNIGHNWQFGEHQKMLLDNTLMPIG